MLAAGGGCGLFDPSKPNSESASLTSTQSCLPLLNAQCVNSQRCSIVDVDAALAAGGSCGAALVQDTERAVVPQAHVDGLQTPTWLRTPEVPTLC